MTAATLLERLHNVRSTGPSSWRADCPNGHRHARGSLAVSETDDGRVLAHCFACSDTTGILAAVGLELADLFPERAVDTSPEGRQRAREAFKRSAWTAALGVLSRESLVVLCAAAVLRQGSALIADDDARLALAEQRIADARAVLT